MGATSPIAFLDQMVSFAVPVVIFVIASGHCFFKEVLFDYFNRTLLIVQLC